MVELRSLLKPYVQNRGVLKTLRLIESLKYLDPLVFNTSRNVNKGSKLIYESLNSNVAQAIGKLGSVELSAIKKYLRYKDEKEFDKLTFNDRNTLHNNAGFFPKTLNAFEKYCLYMIEDVLPEITIVSVWFNHMESNVLKKHAINARKIPIGSLETYLVSDDKWTNILKNKNILVIHPFKETILKQFQVLNKVWPEKLLPEFNLEVITPPHAPSLVKPKYVDWFESLNQLKFEMEQTDFDIALIGAGAYSLPLAVHAKKLGKHGIHIGGALQIYFGIYGNRWEAIPEIKKLKNEFWIRPLQEDTPPNISLIENGCYW